MKCPKCGYLGFETTDRCRNCQYDFSLAPFSSEPELTLHSADRGVESEGDFELPPIKRQSDKLSATALDLDRLFGAPEQRAEKTMPAPPQPTPRSPEPPAVSVVAAEPPAPEPAIEEPVDDPVAEQISSYVPSVVEPEPVDHEAPVPEPEPEPEPRQQLEPEDVIAPVPEPETEPAAEPVLAMEATPAEPEAAPMSMSAAPTDEGALPFDDAPLMPPPVARPPLAVRRSTPEVPRNRPRTTRPVKVESLNLEPAAGPKESAARAAIDTVASLTQAPTLGVRVGAGLIDVLLLVGLDAAVVYLTLRVTGLQNTLEDLRVLPPIPFIGFLGLLTFGYVAAFTVAGGQTIGKMMLSLRVIGDDGRPVDAAGGMLRALGCMLVPLTLGLSYLPALFTSDHRALHDRLAGTRVVQE
jgi:uncharacterized RDD family membrane protein YckC